MRGIIVALAIKLMENKELLGLATLIKNMKTSILLLVVFIKILEIDQL